MPPVSHRSGDPVVVLHVAFPGMDTDRLSDLATALENAARRLGGTDVMVETFENEAHG